MDSIERHQAEEKHAELGRREAIAKIREIVAKRPSCFFSPAAAMGASGGMRPVNVRRVDDAGNLWFLSASDSRTNAGPAAGSAVQIFSQGSPQSGFLHLTGRATVSRDGAAIRELWGNWSTEGVDVPRIAVIRFTPTGGYYWDARHGSAVVRIRMTIGAATMDDSLEGKIAV